MGVGPSAVGVIGATGVEGVVIGGISMTSVGSWVELRSSHTRRSSSGIGGHNAQRGEAEQAECDQARAAEHARHPPRHTHRFFQDGFRSVRRLAALLAFEVLYCRFQLGAKGVVGGDEHKRGSVEARRGDSVALFL